MQRFEVELRDSVEFDQYVKGKGEKVMEEGTGKEKEKKKERRCVVQKTTREGTVAAL